MANDVKTVIDWLSKLCKLGNWISSFITEKIKLRHLKTVMRKPAGQRINISCAYDGFPVPKIEWLWKIKDVVRNIPTNQRRIFKVYYGKGVREAQSTLEISFRDFVGSVEVGCLAKNRKETAKVNFLTPNLSNLKWRLLQSSISIILPTFLKIWRSDEENPTNRSTILATTPNQKIFAFPSIKVWWKLKIILLKRWFPTCWKNGTRIEKVATVHSTMITV